MSSHLRPTTIAAALLSIGLSACGGDSSASHSSPVTSQQSATHSTQSTTHATRPTPHTHAPLFGRVAPPADARAIRSIVHRYYAAAAADDGAKACSLLFTNLAYSVAEDYGQAPGPPALRGSTCSEVLAKLFRIVPKQSSASLAETVVTGIRVTRHKGIVQLHAKAMPHGEIAVARDHGSWKIGWLIGREHEAS